MDRKVCLVKARNTSTMSSRATEKQLPSSDLMISDVDDVVATFNDDYETTAGDDFNINEDINFRRIRYCSGTRNLGSHLVSIAVVIFSCLTVAWASESVESKFVADDPSPVLSAQFTEGNKDVFDDYEEAVGDFKRPSAFLSKFQRSGHLGFIHAFVASISIIIVSELGDKTFFIAAIMAMRHARFTVFLGAMSALIIMTVLSACLGFATTVIPRTYTHYISTALFAIFGLKMLKEGYSMSPDEGQEEYEEVQKTLNKKESEETLLPEDVEVGAVKVNPARTLKRRLLVFVSRIFIQALTMTFLAEWGDRSQLTTIILAAREDGVGVTLGAIVGHGICTALAVLGGRMVAQKISVRSVTIIGGVVFLIFAVSALVMGPGS